MGVCARSPQVKGAGKSRAVARFMLGLARAVTLPQSVAVARIAA